MEGNMGKATLMIAVLFLSMALMVYLPTVKASGTIYIRANGSIDPPTAPIQRNGDIYTFTDNIYNESIVVEKDSIIINGNNYVLQGNGTGNGFELSNRNNVTIENVNVRGFDHGFHLYYSGIWYGNTVINNTIIDCNVGVYLRYCSNNFVIKNNITIIRHSGIWMEDSSNNTMANNIIRLLTGNHSFEGILLKHNNNNNTIKGNVITDCGDTGIVIIGGGQYNIMESNNVSNNYNFGIALAYYASNNVIQKNIVDNNDKDGITIQSQSNSNLIHWNNITNNKTPYFGAGGISIITECKGNLIYHNNFINNALPQAYTNWKENSWDMGYPAGGNYWSDYIGTDLYSGPYQNEPGSDGIGDTPYTIPEELYQQDRYPFISPIQWGIHDISGRNITLYKTIIGQGYNANINVTVANQGDFKETFDVTLCANLLYAGTPLLEDNFDDGVIDSSIWSSEVARVGYGIWKIREYGTSPPFITASEENGKLRLSGYGYSYYNYDRVLISKRAFSGAFSLEVEMTSLTGSGTGYGGGIVIVKDDFTAMHLIQSVGYWFEWPSDYRDFGYLVVESVIDGTPGAPPSPCGTGTPHLGEGQVKAPGPVTYPIKLKCIYDGINQFKLYWIMGDQTFQTTYISPETFDTYRIVIFADARLGEDYVDAEFDNLKLYSSHAIGTQTVTLESGASTTLTFTWNTTDFAKGNYTISAYAWPVLGETDTTDNTFIDGWVVVAMVGDINADGIVDIFDCVRIALAFSATPHDPNWDPNADIDNSNLIDIFDLVIVAIHFAETDP